MLRKNLKGRCESDQLFCGFSHGADRDMDHDETAVIQRGDQPCDWSLKTDLMIISLLEPSLL